METAKNTPTIGFIGFGNMAQAMARGLVEHGNYPATQIVACAAHFDKLQTNTDAIGARALNSAAEVVEASDIVILAVKPYLIEQVVEPIRHALADKIVVSVAAGCDFAFYERVLEEGTHHISTMPNTPIAVGAGIVACEQVHSLTDEEYELFSSVFSPIALLEPVDSKLLATVGTIAGCGPAFAAMFIEALSDAGVKYGLPRATAYRLVSQMVVGTGMLQQQTGQHPGAMKDAVCSPGGTTIRGVSALEQNGFRGAVISAIDAIEGR